MFIPRMFDSTPRPTHEAQKLTHKLYTFLIKKSFENVLQRTL